MPIRPKFRASPFVERVNGATDSAALPVAVRALAVGASDKAIFDPVLFQLSHHVGLQLGVSVECDQLC
jgi:hypothetical protein